MKKASSKKLAQKSISSDDISKKTVAVLLVIAVVLGVITTWVVANRVQFKQEYTTPSTGKVSLDILPQPGDMPKTEPVGSEVGIDVLPAEEPIPVEVIEEPAEEMVE